MKIKPLRIDCPAWVDSFVDWKMRYASDADRMRLVIALSRHNVEQATGGPFGAAIFERERGSVVAVGVNSVVRLNNSTLHGEMVAFMMAQARVGAYSLRFEEGPVYELFSSCEPCAMCLGATLWSGVQRLVWGAHGDDARRLDFEEGPVFAESHAYLRERGIELVPGILREEANAVLELYRERGGVIYNA